MNREQDLITDWAVWACSVMFWNGLVLAGFLLLTSL